ncbi:helix-turn-helix transcriptional regulator [Pseudoalteromonas luteoviolacea]|uniref:AraC family transcriptional regulator n=1 Tax=Pseudoalteromonas luteoviolacea TaxID=43657 RepID=UPI001B36EDD6|nr:AraC family transcriptional regulator [Pseudoalteromonas luteoviolacea]MBQ4811448.1 helix-turn-helix transcriptional regulator [Pseudoalteromonas luteoviolacea]
MPAFKQSDLAEALQQIGVEHHLARKPQRRGVDRELANGSLRFDVLHHHLNVHCTEMQESQDATSTAAIEPSMAITFLFQGTLEFSVGERKYFLEATESPLVFVNMVAEPQVFTRFLSTGRMVRKVTIDVRFPWLAAKLSNKHGKEILNQPLLKSSHVSLLKMSESAINAALNIMSLHKLDSDPYRLIKQESLILSIIPEVLDLLATENNTVVQTVRARPHAPEVIEEVSQNLVFLLQNNVPLEQIAKQLGMSISTLQRFFKSRFNTTVKQYAKQQRLHEAKKAIMLGQLSIGEAAYRAGYNHVSNFTTAFKNTYGVTPKQFLIQHRHD